MPWRILTLCTANVCRSPMAEALLRRHLSSAAVVAEVSSAGLLEEDHPAAPEVVELLLEQGIDYTAHRSRRLTSALIQDSDLVLAMAREHLREAVLLVPNAFGSIFTLRELVRRGEAQPPSSSSSSLAGGAVERVAWLGALGAERQPRQLLGSSREDDIADPMGGALSEFRRTLAELDDLSSRLAQLLAGLV